MPITRLVAEDFRNLQSVDVAPGSQLNLISGENGSGKTSLLEVIYTLAVGRSFRTRKFKNLIAYQSSSFQLFAELMLEGVPRRLGVARAKDGSSIFKLDNESVASAVELATLLPCQVINSRSFGLLEGGPAERRAFIDWLVFHVKPKFKKAWSEYARCLKHRNAMLRSDKMAASEFAIWNKTLAALGEEIDDYRQQMILEFVPVSRDYLAECNFVESGNFEMHYAPGWDKGRPLLEQLEEHYQRDVALGYTNIGPHKSDIRFLFNKKPLVEVFSRGQQKAVVAALHLAQLKVFHSSGARDCLLLLDDLPAELDEGNLQRLCRWIRGLSNVQTFITGIELDALAKLWHSDVANNDGINKMFHVKQGQIQEQSCQWSKS